MNIAKRSIPILLLVTLAGCNKSKPGGGADTSTTFTLAGPAMATSVRQGDAHNVGLKVNRGSEFNQALKIHAETPGGITIIPVDAVVQSSDVGVLTFQVVAGTDAIPGEHVIRFTGSPEFGNPTGLDVKIRVSERSEKIKLHLNAPSAGVLLKPGETKTVKISLDPNPKYQATVTFEATSSPGLASELSPNATVTAADGADIQLAITADKMVSLGMHTIRVTGSADGANVLPISVNVQVVAP